MGGHLGKLGLLAADLLIFDRHRLSWRLATRTVLAMLLPLLASYFLDLPVLVYMALAGFLLSIGDSVDDGDRQQTLRLAIGAVGGSIAIACGVLAGSSLVPALIGTLLWCAIAALMGAWGNAFAVMGLPIAWAFVELGVPASSHTPRYAAALAACWLAGGGVAYVFTKLVRIGGTNAPIREQTAACFRALAEYLEATPQPSGDGSAISPETRVRATIANARRIADASRRGQQGAQWQRQLVLIELVDRMFAQAAAWRENARPGAADAAPLAAAAREVARRTLIDATSFPDADRPAGPGLPAEIIEDLARALRIASGAPPLGLAMAIRHEGPTMRLAGMLASLRACLDPRSVVGRHALRFGLVTSAAVAVFWFFPPPFGYWIPLTVTVVLKPYAGVTLGRTVQRVLGTALGVLLGTALMPLLPGAIPQVAAVVAAFFCMMAVLPMNYSLAILFLSLGVVPFEHLVFPGLTLDVGLWRLVATAIGAALAIAGGHLLWPNFERRELAGLLRRALRSAAGYAAAALAVAKLGPAHRALVEARRTAGIDTTNFQMTAQRSLSELGAAPVSQQRIVASAAVLQRMLLVINAIAHRTPGDFAGGSTSELQAAFDALSNGTSAATDTVAVLRRWGGERTTKAPGDPLINQVDTLASQIELLAAFEGG